MGRDSAKTTLKVKGDLSYNGDLDVAIIEVGRNLEIDANLQAEKIFVSKKIKVTGRTKTTQLVVGGDCKVERDLECNEAIIQGKCNVGGNAKCCTKITADTLDVAGDIQCTYMVVNKNCKAKRISAVFSQVRGNIVAEVIDTKGGYIYCGGSVTGEVIGGGEVYEHFTDWDSI